MTVRRRLSIVGFAILAAAAVNAHAQDPGTPGPLAVTTQEYNFGDTAFTPAGFPGPVEVRASVHRPTNLAGGPFPLVVFLHGRHLTCSDGATAFMEWPCSVGRSTIPSFQGYAYISAVLASHGYIVVSISANGVNARDNSVFDLGAQARAELIQHHLDRWNTWATTGGAPFGSTFVGRVDLTTVGTMGHSRGGEGVVRHFLHNQSLGSPYGIRAVFPLAPVDFSRPVITGVALAVLLPYCDGDVADLQGVHYYDDARYVAPGDLTAKHTTLVMGANHNFYNTVWTPGSGFPGSVDDWTAFVSGGSGDPFCGTGAGNGRLTAAGQRGTGLAYITGFFRRYLGGETAFAAMLKGDAPPPPSATTSEIFSSYHAPDAAAQRRDVNRLLDAVNLTTNTLGGAASQTGFSPYDLCGGELPQPQHCLSGRPNSRQPHTTPSARSSARGLSQLRGGWSATTAGYRNDLPAGSRNVSAFQVFQFRASVNFTDARNPAGVPQDFSVRLTDGTGATSSTLVGLHSAALFYPPGAVGPVPKVVLNTIRIPLSAFSGLNLTDIRSVELRFDQTSSGALLVTDLAFADAASSPSSADLVETAVSNPPASVLQGGSFAVTDTTQNQGSGGAAASETRFYLSLNTTKGAGDQLLSPSRAVPPLGAGATSTNTVTVTVPGATPTGTYFLLACADDTGVVAEAHEGNNCRASATTVQVQAAPTPAPDLVVTSLTVPASVIVGIRFTVTDTTANQGTGPATVSTTRFFLSLDNVRNSGDKVIGTRPVPELAAGTSSTESTLLLIKENTVAGMYFVIACADDLKYVTETGGEGNNCRASSSAIAVTGPDLVVTSVSNPPASRTIGSTFSVTDTTANQGNAGTTVTTTTRYFLSLDAVRNSGDKRLTGSRSVGPLLPGASSNGTATVTIPSTTAPATYFLLACADDKTVVKETNEKNNCRASASKVTVN